MAKYKVTQVNGQTNRPRREVTVNESGIQAARNLMRTQMRGHEAQSSDMIRVTEA